MKRILVVFIVLIFALTPFAIAGCAGEGKKDGGKAVIILPGILGSILVNQSGNSMYFFNPGGDFGLGFGEGDYKPDVRFGDFRYILSVLTDEDGNNVECKLHVGSVHTPNLRPPHPFDELQHSGGTINHLLPLYSGLMAEFGDDHTVVTWQYDWRMGIAPAADKLDAFIKAQNYSEVVLVAHSMGGLLANAYLAKGQAQRDKVSLYVTYAAPHGGVVDALYALETGDQVFFDLSDFGAIGTMVGGVIDTVLQMPCFPDLIPNKALLESSFYKNQEAGVPSFIEIEYEKGKYKFLTDWDEIFEFYQTRPWTNYVANKEKQGERKPVVTKAFEVMDSYYLGNSHVSHLVNTQYIVATEEGHPATIYMRYNLNEDGSYSVEPITASNRHIYQSNEISDMVVPKGSAVCGLPYSDPRIFEVTNGHVDVVWDNVPFVISKIKALWK